MIMHTTSEVIDFARRLENGSAKFYEDLSAQYATGVDILLSFVKENKKNVVQIERAYYGVISDAIEGCFAFNVESDDYALTTAVTQGMLHSDALNQAVDMEKTIVKFYLDAAEQAGPLMADVPRAFKMVAGKRDDRERKLRLLLTGKST